MNHKTKSFSSTRIKFGVIIFSSIFLMLVLESIIQLYQYRRDVRKTSEVLLNQVVDIIGRNQQSEIELIKGLKADYLIRAKSVAFILKENPKIEKDINELKKLCDMSSVDEINIFDKTGTIVSGTVPVYYGYSVNSGEQIHYFAPMLEDKSLTMCQDPMPNTALSKSMVYAMVWKEDGSAMVQIGVEPLRFTEEVNKNKISHVISEFPAYQGTDIYVANKVTGNILGATDRQQVGRRLNEIGIEKPTENLEEIRFFTSVVNGKISYCSFRELGNYCIGVTESLDSILKMVMVTIAICFLYLVIAACVIVGILHKMNSKVDKEREEKNKIQEQMLIGLKEQYAIIDEISRDFTDIIIVNIETQTSSMFKINGKTANYDEIRKNPGRPYEQVWNSYIEKHVIPEDADMIRRKVKIEHVLKKLEKEPVYYCTYRCFSKEGISNFQIKFMRIDFTEKNSDNYIFLAIRNIDEILAEQKRLAFLEQEANLDKLTGFYNRRAYEEDIAKTDSVSNVKDLVFVSMDVNGLKTVNDSLGHDQGDVLLKGAAECMRLCFESYGRVYRTGGDEFCAIIFADVSTLEKIKADFEETIIDWTKKHDLILAISAGYVEKRENLSLSIGEVIKLADKRMYEAKAAFYKQNGIDRRSERVSYDVLRDAFTKRERK